VPIRDSSEPPPDRPDGATDLQIRISRLSAAKRGLLDARLKAVRAAEVAKASRVASEPLPLSFAQARLWFLHELEPDLPAYNVGRAVRLRGPLQIPLLQRSIDHIVARHETLRMNFVSVDGQPHVEIRPERSVRIRVVDVEGQSDAEVRRTLETDFRRLFGLATDPLLRVTLYRVDPEEHILVLSMHHIVSDRWSHAVLWGELSASYGALIEGREPLLPPLRVQYVDFAIWQRERFEQGAWAASLDYWKRHLAGAPQMLDLPRDGARDAPGGTGAIERRVLPGRLVESLRALCVQERVTLYVALLAACQALLSRCSGQEDVLVGSPVAGRPRVEFERLLGLFVNTVALRTNLSGDPTFREVLARVREVALDAYVHQDVPFDKLIEVLNPRRAALRTPLVELLFVLQNAPGARPVLAGLEVQPIDLHTGTAKFDLTWVCIDAGTEFVCSIEYDTGLFERATIDCLLNDYQTLLEEVVADPSRRLQRLSRPTAARRREAGGP
jgi:aspartate racemase